MQGEREIEPGSVLLFLSKIFIYLECRESVNQFFVLCLFLLVFCCVVGFFYNSKYKL